MESVKIKVQNVKCKTEERKYFYPQISQILEDQKQELKRLEKWCNY
jgi:hypothetical protein